MRHKFIGLSLVGLVVLTGCPDDPPGGQSATKQVAIPTSAQQVVQLEQAYSFYVQASTGGPVPNQTLMQKYQAAVTSPGLDLLVASELNRLVGLLSAQQALAVARWQSSSSACVANSVILVANQPSAGGSGGTVCISGLLLSSLFLQVSGTSLLSLHDTLVSWGIDPLTFDGSYNGAVLAPHGIQPTDWNAFLAAKQPLWNDVTNTLDFVIARQLMTIVLSTGSPTVVPSESTVDLAAKALVTQANHAFDASQLLTFLQNSQAKYPDVAWGYEHLGDASAIESVLSGL